jgi:hypothetical protein
MATWTHEIKRIAGTSRGYDVTVEFTRDGTGDIRTCTFHFDHYDQVANVGPARFAKKKNRYELRWSVLNDFDLGDEGGESKELLRTLIVAIRNNPDLTVAQAVTWYDNNYPNALYRGEQLFQKMREWLENEIGYTPTWDQFKTYVINNVLQR